MKLARNSWALAAAALCLLGLTTSRESLLAVWKDGQIGISAPRLHFLTGRSLDRLHDGMAAPFDLQLSLLRAGQTNPVQRAVERFVVSYDLWEEKYSVTRLRSPATTASHLSARQVETWCLDRLLAPVAGALPEEPLRLRLEIRGEEPREAGPLVADSGISLTALVEVFSRPARMAQQKWVVESPTFRIADFRR